MMRNMTLRRKSFSSSSTDTYFTNIVSDCSSKQDLSTQTTSERFLSEVSACRLSRLVDEIAKNLTFAAR